MLGRRVAGCRQAANEIWTRKKETLKGGGGKKKSKKTLNRTWHLYRRRESALFSVSIWLRHGDWLLHSYWLKKRVPPVQHAAISVQYVCGRVLVYYVHLKINAQRHGPPFSWWNFFPWRWRKWHSAHSRQRSFFFFKYQTTSVICIHKFGRHPFFQRTFFRVTGFINQFSE